MENTNSAQQIQIHYSNHMGRFQKISREKKQTVNDKFFRIHQSARKTIKRFKSFKLYEY